MKAPYEATLARRALVARDEPPGAAGDAAALLEAIDAVIGGDFGEAPSTVAGMGATKAHQKALDEAFTRIIGARFQRQETLASLFAIAARDASFQVAAFARLDTLPGDARFRAAVQHALMTAPRLAPPLLEAARQWLTDADASRRITATIALLRQGDDVAYAALGASLGALGALDVDDTAQLARAKEVVEAGASTGFWAGATERWRDLLARCAALADAPFDPASGDLGRARWQLGMKAKEALAAPTTVAPPRPAAPAPRATPDAQRPAARAAPIDRKRLRSARGREEALDALGDWVVDALADASDDDARAILRGAIAALYDIREAADQPRGEFAGEFFQVDGVGLDNTGRPVPWQRLRARVGDARVVALDALFDEVLPTVDA